MSAQPIPRALIQGYMSGALILTFFGALWALLTLSALMSQPRMFLIIIVVIVTAMLSYAAIMILRAAQQLPQSVSPDARAQGITLFKWFPLIVVIEFVAIALASRLLIQANRDELIPLIIALIVGIHFLPLATIFHVPAYYLTGTIMIMLAGGALIALFFNVTLGGIYAWSVVVGLGNAVILWLTALYLLSVGRHLLKL